MTLAAAWVINRVVKIEAIRCKRHFTLQLRIPGRRPNPKRRLKQPFLQQGIQPDWQMPSDKMARVCAGAFSGTDHQRRRGRVHYMVGKEIIGLALDRIRTSLTSPRGCRTSRSPFVRRPEWRWFRIAPLERLSMCRGALDTELRTSTNLNQLIRRGGWEDQGDKVPPAARPFIGCTLLCRLKIVLGDAGEAGEDQSHQDDAVCRLVTDRLRRPRCQRHSDSQ
jgi:hypothetical protein